MQRYDFIPTPCSPNCLILKIEIKNNQKSAKHHENKEIPDLSKGLEKMLLDKKKRESHETSQVQASSDIISRSEHYVRGS